MKLPIQNRVLAGAVACLLAASASFSQTPAFPGALGFGANATGGRNGTVYHVTTLADSGAGSFRTAVSSPNRIVVFDVAGYITISSEVALNDNLTIAGQTAPGGGIAITGNEVSCGASTNVIIRHMRFRPGSSAPQGSAHCLNMYASSNIVLDHVSFEFAPWNNIGGVNIDRTTIQNCISAAPINQQFGAHIEHLNSTCAFLYNIWAHGHNRQPLATINTIYINNTIYNYQAGFTTHTSGSFFYDILNNYFITGPATSSAGNDFYQVDSQQSIYSSGNLRDSDNNGSLGGSPTAPSGVVVLGSPWSSVTATIPTFSPASSFRINVSSVGAWPRDQVDDLMISHVKKLGSGTSGTGAGTAGPGGGLYDSQADTGLPNGGLGTLNGGVVPLDSDGDGMPDFWEQANGWNLGSNDAMTIGGDGYARIEKYINWLAEPHAQTTTNVPVTVDLWDYTSGFTNASPTYLVNNATNGSVVLSNNHFAVFTPTANVSGVGGFRFSVAGSDGTAYTNTVTIVISALQPPSNLIWRGDGTANVWSTTASNWINGASFVAFNTTDNVTFDDTGSNTPAINLTGSLAAGTVNVVAGQNYTFGGSGALVGSATLFKTGSGSLFLNTTNTFSGGTIINDGVVQVGNGVTANGNLGGNITNNDTLIFANPAALTSSAAISGSGTLTKNNGGTLTITGNQSFTNLTTINAGTVEFSGTPPQGDITNRGIMIFKPTAAAVAPGDISGPGSVVNNGSGTIYLTGANSYTGGTTNTSGNLVLSNNTAAGTGPVIYSGGSVMVGGGCVITNDFSIPGSATTDLCMQGTNGTGTWAGNIVNLGSSAQWRPGADSGGTLIFTGTANQGSHNFIVPRGSVQFASNAVVSATGSATAFGRDTSGGNRSANVTIRDNAVVTLGVCSLGGNQAGGNVTLTIQNSAALNCGANNFDLQNVNRTTATTFIRLNGGTMTVGGFTKTKTSQTNVINFNGGVLKAGANNSSFLPAFNIATNIVQAGGAKIDDGGFTITIPAPLIHDPALGATLDGGLTKLGAGYLFLSGSNTYTGPTTILAGRLDLVPSGSINASKVIHVGPAGGFSVANLNGSAAYTLTSGRTLSGSGTVIGNLTIASGATLLPGSNSIGRLTFDIPVASLTLAAGSTNIFEISHSPLTNDSVKIFGALTNGGALIVSNLSGTLAAADSFKLFDAGSYSSSFNSVVLPALTSGLVWDTNGLNTNGTIRVISTNNVGTNSPVFGTMAVLGANAVFSGSNGNANATYWVLATTNLSLPATQWTRLTTNQFDSNGQFIFTNGIEQASPLEKYFMLQSP